MSNWFQVITAVTEIKSGFDNGWYYPAGQSLGYLLVQLLGKPGDKIDYSNSKIVVWILDTEE